MNHEHNGNQPSGESNNQAPLPTPSKPTVAKTEAENPEEKAGSDKTTTGELKTQFRWLDIASLCVNAALAVTGILVLCVYARQLNVMQVQLDQMKGSSLQTDRLIAEAVRQSGAAIDTARAAQANVLAITRQMRQDFRPWIRIELASPSGLVDISDPSNPKVGITLTTGKPITVSVHMVNAGKTPAKYVVGMFDIQIAGSNDPMMFSTDSVSNGKPGIFTSRRKQFHPLFRGQFAPTTTETGVIFPGQNVFSEATFSRIGAASGIVQPLSREEMAGLMTGAFNAYLISYIRYRDVFGTEHWTRDCRSFVSNGPGNPRCSGYNAADENY